jgi:LmbE family N-acetylglucosaminyl deacetylase
MIDTLIIAAHDDDEALMAGGYIAKYASQKEIVVCVVIGCTDDQKAASAKNAEAFGYTIEPIYEKQFATPLHVLAAKINQVILKHRPQTIITHTYFDTHQEHKLVHDAVEIATRAIDMREAGGGHFVPNILLGLGTGLYENSITLTRPQCFVGLSRKEVNRKVDMMNRYGLEMKGIRSRIGAITDARFWGKMNGTQFAEAFIAKRIAV